MTNKEKAQFIYEQLVQLFPDAKCELHYRNGFELLIAVVLSAQTTDKSVNEVTPKLFERYQDCDSLAQADLTEVQNCIQRIGLYRTKAKNIILLANQLVQRFDGKIPTSVQQLITLPGVGRKTANVVVSELFQTPAIAVDTHVARVSKRLKIAKIDDDVLEIERKLNRLFPVEQWCQLHHLFIFFGRYHCTSKNPKCDRCPFQEICRKDKQV